MAIKFSLTFVGDVKLSFSMYSQGYLTFEITEKVQLQTELRPLETS